MRGLAAGLLSLLALVSLGGCGTSSGETDPHLPKPSAKLIAGLHRQPAPVYWLGAGFRGLRRSGIDLSPDGVTVAYGVPSCYSDPGSGSGCDYPITIETGGERANPFFPPAGRGQVHVGHVGPAALVWVHRHAIESGTLFSGDWSIFIRTGRSAPGVREVARRLSLANEATMERDEGITDRAHPFLSPTPISCPSLRFVVRWWTSLVEREFGQNPNCTPYGS